MVLQFRYLLDLVLLLWRPRYWLPKHVRRIAVVQQAKMGDMVCTTPLLRALKSAYPGAHITVFGDSVNRDLLVGSQDVDSYILFTESLVPTLLAQHKGMFDVGIIPAPSITALHFLVRVGARMILAPRVVAAWSPHETRWYKLLRFFTSTVTHDGTQYAPREYLRLLEPIGIHTTDTRKHLTVSASAAQRAEVLLEDAQYPRIGIVPSAGNKIKMWPAERFAELAQRVSAEYGGSIVCLGGPRDSEEVQAFLAALAHSVPCVDLSNQLSVEDLKAVVAQLDVIVACDTGTIYIAEAFGVPTVDIVGPVDENVQPPRGPMNAVVVPPYNRIPQMNIVNARVMDKKEARRQALSIEVSQVFDAVQTVLAVTRGKPTA